MNARVPFAVFMLVLLMLALTTYLLTANRSKELQLIGIVDADEVIVSSRIPGRIEALKVDEGQRVEIGQLIATIEADDLGAAHDQAVATARQQTELLARAKDIAAETDAESSAQVRSAEAQLLSATATLEQAEATTERQRRDTVRTMTLAKEGVVSQQDTDEAELKLKGLEKSVDAAKDAVSVAKAQVEVALAKRKDVAITERSITAAADTAIAAQAAARQAAINQHYAVITSPITGMIGTRAARQGETVAAGTPIVTVLDLSHTWVYVPLPESYADAVAIGNVLKIIMPSGTAVDGQVVAKAAAGDFATQRDVSRRKRDLKTVRLKLVISNPDYRFVPGMTAEVHMSPTRSRP
jgi:HlyD family secretion protein